jgi:hypothetical protein
VTVGPPRLEHGHSRSRLAQPTRAADSRSRLVQSRLYAFAVRVCLVVARGRVHHDGMYLIQDLLAARWTPSTLWSMVTFAAGVAAWATCVVDRALGEPTH